MTRPPALVLSALSLCLGSALLLTGCSGEQDAAAEGGQIGRAHV